jgi:Patatin-like phospholipase
VRESQPHHDTPIPLHQVLDDEFRCLHGVSAAETPAHGTDETRLRAILRRHRQAGHSALCLSGGGIRSAAFALGVLQGLARAGVLGQFDYLSTVSGGGYIGGWLSAWRVRAHELHERTPFEQLGAEGLEPAPLTRVRRLVRFLDPRIGALSVDVWTLVTTILRNLLVNWLVLVPLLAAAAMVPRLYLGLLGLPSQPELVSHETLLQWYTHGWILVVPLVAVAATYAAFELPSLGNRAHGQTWFLILFLVPVVLIHLLLSVHRYWAWQFGDETSVGNAMIVSTLGMVIPWVVGGALSDRWWRPWTWLAAAAAGAGGRAIIWWCHGGLTRLAHDNPQLFVVVDLPIMLALLFLQIAVFIGLASRDMSSEDREWWARAGAWILIVAVTWLVGSLVIIFGPILIDRVVVGFGLSHYVGRAALGLFTVLSGSAAGRLGSSSLASGRWQAVKKLGFVLAAPAIVALLVALISDGNLHVLKWLHDRQLFAELPHLDGASLPEDLLLLGALLTLGLALGRLVSVNQFSLHGMYKDRLVRTFLGASRPPEKRHPSPFTGFDAADNLPMTRLAPLGRPLHVVNVTLNLVDENTLATQERKATSFTMTALHAGSRHLRYRPSAAYAGGLSLGEAMTTSGAAVSPNMGAGSSPALTFLLALFNARLGVWLGNPGHAGQTTWTRGAPGFGVTPLLNELLGRTSDRNPYVYLSDGGHFENLGLYEMILRRCQHIVVSDAGCDPTYCFEDFANAIRKVRLDFGIDVEFSDGLRIVSPEGPPACRARWAVGRIKYSNADPETPDGWLLYLKPAITGDEPVDVANYARVNTAFPHEPTANQWFDEAQLESYRMLGLHTVTTLTARRECATVADLRLAAQGQAVSSTLASGGHGQRAQ